MLNFMMIRPMEAELFCVGRQTDGQPDRYSDITKLVDAVLQFRERSWKPVQFGGRESIWIYEHIRRYG
jgi:hypothetical protein